MSFAGQFESEDDFLAAYHGEWGEEWEAEADALIDDGEVEIDDYDGEVFDEEEDSEEDQVGDYIAREIERLEGEEGREFSAEDQQAIAALAVANWTADGPNVEGAFQHLVSEADYGYEEGWKSALDAEVTALERDVGRKLTSKEIGRVVDRLPQGEIPDLVALHGDEFRGRAKSEDREERLEYLGEIGADAREQFEADNPSSPQDLDAPEDERQARLMAVAETARAEGGAAVRPQKEATSV